MLFRSEQARDEAIKRSIDLQDFVDAKRDFETDQQLLQIMKQKQMEETIACKMQIDSVLLHQSPVISNVPVSPSITFNLALGVILGAAYMLYLYRRVIFGKLVREDLKSILDLSAREVAVFVPLVVVVIWMGVYPSTFLSPVHASVAKLIDNYQLAKAAAGSSAAGPTRSSSST